MINHLLIFSLVVLPEFVAKWCRSGDNYAQRHLYDKPLSFFVRHLPHVDNLQELSQKFVRNDMALRVPANFLRASQLSLCVRRFMFAVQWSAAVNRQKASDPLKIKNPVKFLSKITLARTMGDMMRGVAKRSAFRWQQKPSICDGALVVSYGLCPFTKVLTLTLDPF